MDVRFSMGSDSTQKPTDSGLGANRRSIEWEIGSFFRREREMRYTDGMTRSSQALLALLVGIDLVFFGPSAFAQSMASTNYAIPWDAWSAGGGEQGTSTSYAIDDTIGGLTVGTSTSASYALRAGYRLGDESPLAFSVAMAPVGGTSKTYTSLNITDRTVTLSALPNPFSAGQAIAVIEAPGLAQKTVVGRIVAVSGVTITVDRFDGQTGSMSASPASGNVVALSGGDIAFGEISTALASVATGMINVHAPTENGYSVFVQAAAPLASSDHTFTGVADGTVSAGAEEYGIRTHGTNATLSLDMPVTTTALTVQESSDPSAVGGDRTAFLYKLAISSATPAGSYGQAVYFTLTPNY